MPEMTLGDMRDYVRAFLDSDDTELPDTLIDVWLYEGTANIQRRFEPWNFYEATWDLTTDEASFSLIDEVDTITSIEAENYKLEYQPHEAAVQKYAWGTDVTGSSREWSLWGGTVYLWPAPAESSDFTLRGYRVPTEATEADDVVDLPNEFHPLVCEWMLARAYEQQDDEIMSQQKFARFEQELEAFRRRYYRVPNAGVVSIGQNCENTAAPGRLLYDFESRYPL